jgi:hypothetical protein
VAEIKTTRSVLEITSKDGEVLRFSQFTGTGLSLSDEQVRFEAKRLCELMQRLCAVA